VDGELGFIANLVRRFRFYPGSVPIGPRRADWTCCPSVATKSVRWLLEGRLPPLNLVRGLDHPRACRLSVTVWWGGRGGGVRGPATIFWQVLGRGGGAPFGMGEQSAAGRKGGGAPWLLIQHAQFRRPLWLSALQTSPKKMFRRGAFRMEPGSRRAF